MPIGGRQVVAEFIGTAFLLAAMVGSGIMAQKLAGRITVDYGDSARTP